MKEMWTGQAVLSHLILNCDRDGRKNNLDREYYALSRF